MLPVPKLGTVTTGVDAAGDAIHTKYVLPNAPPQPLGLLPPSGIGPPAIRVAFLGAAKVNGGTGVRLATFSMQQFIDGKTYETVPEVANIRATSSGGSPSEIRRFNYNLSRTGHWDRAVGVAAPDLPAPMQAVIADRLVAQNSIRLQKAQAGGATDGFRIVNALGYFIAVAAAHRDDVNPTDPEVITARRVVANIVQQMVDAGGKDEDGKPRVSAASAQAFLTGAGTKLNASTRGWQQELAAIKKESWYVPFVTLPPQSLVSGQVPTPVVLAAVSHHDSPAYLAPVADLHTENARANAIADQELAVRTGQERAIVNIRVAARRAINAGHDIGGPQSWWAV